MFLSYVLSFVYLGIYWNNHHHMLHACQRVNGGILWANLHLLFWLSLVPFVTGWMGENHFGAGAHRDLRRRPADGGDRLLHPAVADHRRGRVPVPPLKQAIGGDWKGKLSPVIYVVAIGVSFVAPRVALALYALVALIWLVPDRAHRARVPGEMTARSASRL